jgi:flagellar biosynthesis protein FlhA
MIVESIAEARTTAATPEAICEHVRQHLAFQIVAEVRATDGTVPLVQLAADWEERFAQHQIGEASADVALPPDLFQKLTSNIAEKLNRASEAGHFPAIITSVRRRRFLRTILAAKGITNPVLSFEELGTEARPSLVGLVST